MYPDKFSESKAEYLKRIGDKDEEGYLLKEGLFRKNSKESGHYHSNWLSMMYPRLFLARNLLREDGVIFVSIDDNEVHNLRMIMNEVFGEENFVALLPTIMNLKGNNDQYAFSGTHEYTLVFTKTKEKTVFNEFNIEEEENEEWGMDERGYFKKGSGLLATSFGKTREERPYMYFPILIKDNSLFLLPEKEYENIYDNKKEYFNDKYVDELKQKYEKQGFCFLLPIDSNGNLLRWTWGYSGKFKTHIKDIIITKTKNGYSLNKKQRPSIGDLPSKKPKSVFYKPEYSSGNGTEQIKILFNNKIFISPKPIDLIKDLLILGMNKSDIVLDFFSGSGTTAHAVLNLNKEDGVSREFICVQLPEKTKEDSEAYKAGYKTIAEICKERIRRVIKNIKDEKKKNPDLFADQKKDLDLGFKVFKLKQSNFKIWRTDIAENEKELGKQLDAFEIPVKKEAKIENMLWEILLKSGYDLNTRIQEKKIAGCLIYSVADGDMIVCLSKINEDLVKKIAKQKPKKCICLDILFAKNDQLKTNTVLQMKDAGVEFKTI
ncbi:MAG: site-specific DNA-methyltransferase [Candidatus Firestonebacteria bacterium]